MLKNYYLISIQRYFSTPVPFFLLGSVPLMVYGYFENDTCFWIGLGITVLIFVINHLLMISLTRTFGQYATVREVNYVTNILSGKCKAFSEQECDSLFTMVADLAGNDKITIDDIIRQINTRLKDKADGGNAEAYFVLGMYHRRLSSEADHNAVARQLIEKSADLGWEDAKRMLKKAKRWT